MFNVYGLLNQWFLLYSECGLPVGVIWNLENIYGLSLSVFEDRFSSQLGMTFLRLIGNFKLTAETLKKLCSVVRHFRCLEGFSLLQTALLSMIFNLENYDLASHIQF